MPLVKRLIRLANNVQADQKNLTRQINGSSYGSARLEIRVDNPQSRYYSGDVVSGEVILELQREVDVTEITLKYKVDELTELIGPEEIKHPGRRKSHDRDSENRVFKSEARIFERSLRLFPNKEQSQVLTGKLTLPKGTHTYPFSIRIPGHENDNFRQLPPSFTAPDNLGSIYHHLKATLRRSSAFKQNARYELPMEFLPCGPQINPNEVIKATNSAQLTSGSLFKHSNGSANVSCKFPRALQAGRQFSCEVMVTSDQHVPIMVANVTITLFADCSVRAQGREEKSGHHEILFSSRLAEQGTVVNLTPLLGGLGLPQEMIPSFSTKYITTTYRLLISVDVGTGNSRPTQVQVAQEIPVYGPYSFESSHHAPQPHSAIGQQSQLPSKQHGYAQPPPHWAGESSPAGPSSFQAYPPEKSTYTGPASTQSQSYPPEKSSYSGQPSQAYPPEKSGHPPAAHVSLSGPPAGPPPQSAEYTGGVASQTASYTGSSFGTYASNNPFAASYKESAPEPHKDDDAPPGYS